MKHSYTASVCCRAPCKELLLVCLIALPSRFKEQCEGLAQMKSEAEHLQHLMQKTKVKIQRDFEAYWSSQHSSKPKRTPRSSSREVSRSSVRGNPGESLSPRKERESGGDGRNEGGRMASPRTAWRTPPGYESLQGAVGDSTGSLALGSSQKRKASESFSRQHLGSVAARFRKQALDQHNLADVGVEGRISPRRNLDSDIRTGPGSDPYATPGSEVEDKVNSFKVTSTKHKTWNPAVSVLGANKDYFSEDVRKIVTSPTHDLTSPRNMR